MREVQLAAGGRQVAPTFPLSVPIQTLPIQALPMWGEWGGPNLDPIWTQKTDEGGPKGGRLSWKHLNQTSSNDLAVHVLWVSTPFVFTCIRMS